MLKMSVAVIIFIFLIPFFSHGENSLDGVLGTVREVNCKEGQLEITSQSGEKLVFHLTKDVIYKRIKGCEELEKGSKVILKYKPEGDRKIVSSINTLKPRKEQK